MKLRAEPKNKSTCHFQWFIKNQPVTSKFQEELVAYFLLHPYIWHAHNCQGRKGWPMTFMYMKKNSVHPYIMPESDSSDCRLDLKCYFQKREQSFNKQRFCCQHQASLPANTRTSGVISQIVGNPI